MVKVIAHRGSGIGPLENTLLAMRDAVEWGVDCIECDVQNSKDGVAIIIHDLTLERLTNGEGLVAEKTLKELKTLNIGAGEQIPTLTELLDFVQSQSKLQINIDVKVADLEAIILEDVIAHGLLDRTLISSFIPPVLRKFRELNIAIATGLLYEFDLVSAVEVAKKVGCTAINPQLHFVSDELVSKCHREGLQINPWVVNEPQDMKRFIALGVDGIITDVPQRLLQILKYREGG